LLQHGNPKRTSNHHQPTTNPSVEEIEVDDDKEDCIPNHDRRRRRSTMPEMMLQDDIEALRQRMQEKGKL